MNDISKEYGTALFALAVEADKKRPYAEDLKLVSDAFKESEAYYSFLSSPSVSRRERLDSIQTVFGGAISADVLSFLKLLTEKGRMSCFFDAEKAYLELLDASERIMKVKVTTAVALTDEELDKLKQKLEKRYGGTVVLQTTLDPALLGGIVVEAEDKVMDGSLRNRLQQVKEVIST